MRNTPNALGVIDSTVSSKAHKLYHLYLPGGAEKRGSQIIFQLSLHPTGAEKVFSREEVDAFNIIGADGSANCHKRVIELIRRKHEIIESDQKQRSDGVDGWEQGQEIERSEKHPWPVSDIYHLQTIGDDVDLAEADESERIIGKRRIKPELAMPALSYVYFLIFLADIRDHSFEAFKTNILLAHDEFDGIDIIGSERYNVVDMVPWGEAYGITIELVHPDYKKQLAMFTYLFTLINTGRFKAPPCTVSGSKTDDIVREELVYFDHDADMRWFGSLEKQLKYGVQDDVMFAMGNGIFGGRW